MQRSCLASWGRCWGSLSATLLSCSGRCRLTAPSLQVRLLLNIKDDIIFYWSRQQKHLPDEMQQRDGEFCILIGRDDEASCVKHYSSFIIIKINFIWFLLHLIRKPAASADDPPDLSESGQRIPAAGGGGLSPAVHSSGQ